MGFLSKLFGGGNKIQLEKAIQEGAFLVDVRTPSEFKSGSVKGATNIPLNQLSNKMSKFKNKKHIVVFCQSGMRSGQARRILKSNGFEDTINGGTWIKVSRIVNKK